MKRRVSFCALLVLLCLIGGPRFSSAQGQGMFGQGGERILEYKSFVTIQADGWVDIVESQTFNVTGEQITHGITRWIPLTYKDENGKRVHMPYQIVSVSRDGRKEPVSSHENDGSVTLRIGSGESYVPAGRHTWEIHLRLNKMITFTKDYDELYYNVTGSEVKFPIDNAECIVVLPNGARPLQYGARTGAYGSLGENVKVYQAENGLKFVLTVPLAPREGMTVALSFPKGFVAQSQLTFWERIGYVPILIAGIVWVTLVFGLLWLKWGRDPAMGTVIPLFYPPDGVSASGARWLKKRSFDSRGFAAGIISLAVKGWIKLFVDKEKGLLKKKRSYRIERREDVTQRELSSDEKMLFSALLGKVRGKLQLDTASSEVLMEAKNDCMSDLRAQFGHLYNSNVGISVLGFLLTMLPLGAGIMAVGDDEAGMTLMGITIGTAILLGLVMVVIRGSGSEKSLLMNVIGFVVIGLFVFSGDIGIPSGIHFQLDTEHIVQYALAFVSGVISAVFASLMGSPTAEWQKLRTKLDGFEMYISMAEKDRMNLLNPPERTPELFERFLPYALALGVEQKWGECFADVLSKATVAGTYTPGWYVGPMDVFNLRSLTYFSSALDNTVDRAMVSETKHESSGGSIFGGGGFGGFSGGGRGGGGTGGW